MLCLREGGQPMTRTARKASLLVVFLLLASAATAYAECAWVLWSSWQGGQHTVSSKHEDRVGCIRAIDRNLIRWGGGKFTGGSTPEIDLTGLTEGKGRFWTVGLNGKVIGLGEYLCLPDTVDPRGPKAK